MQQRQASHTAIEPRSIPGPQRPGAPGTVLRRCLTLLGSALLLSACQRGIPQLPAQPNLPPPNKAGQPQNDPQGDAVKTSAQQRIEQAALKQGWRAGHLATVACLQGERAQTDGNELRCEDQAYVEQNYR